MQTVLKSNRLYVLALAAMFAMLSHITEAQRLRHGGGGGGGARRSVARPANGNTRSINGGSQHTVSRPSRQPSRPSVNDNQRNNSVGDRKSNGNKANVGNKVNIDNSKRNVNVNVDRSRNVQINNRNTMVRHNNLPYRRPPYVYGGRRYYSYHPYHYHPYRPYHWGPVWHPWGFFVAAMATTAIIISIENQQYHYDQGVYYVAGDGGYTVVQAPVGATITVLPEGSEKVVVNETTNNYYYGGTYYEKSGDEFKVVPPTSGTLVENLPEGGEEVKLGDITYVKYGETYYQPTEKDGKQMYEVVDIQEGEN